LDCSLVLPALRDSRRVLYGISGLDPVAYLFAIVLFALAALLAVWLPARRALHLDPMSALRND